jgi:hypothetical protein
VKPAVPLGALIDERERLLDQLRLRRPDEQQVRPGRVGDLHRLRNVSAPREVLERLAQAAPRLGDFPVEQRRLAEFKQEGRHLVIEFLPLPG